MARSLAPYIHVILTDVVSITLYINKPLVRLTTAHYQSAVSMISFAQVLTAQWSDTIPRRNVRFQVGITSPDIPFQQQLEPKQEINDCLVFLVFSCSYDAERLDVLNQVRVQSSYIIIYCWPIIFSFTRYDTVIPFMFTCMPTALIALPQSQLPSFNHNGSLERPSPLRSSLLTLLTMQRQRSRTGKGESMGYQCCWAVD